MKKYFTVILALVFSSTAQAKDLQHFNPEVLGHSTKDPIKLLYAPKLGDVGLLQ
jgi:hypothetical protein